MKKNIALALVGFMLVPLAACSSVPSSSGTHGSEPQTSGSAPALITVVEPYAAPSPGGAGEALNAVGIKYGFYKNAGVTTKLEYANGSTAAIQAVASGTGDITPAELGSAMQAYASGVPVKVIGSTVINWPWKMATLSNSDIKKPADLKGKKIGVISLASGSYAYTKSFLKTAGLSEKDVQIIAVGTGPSAADAIKNGKIDVLALYDRVYSQLLGSDPGLSFDYMPNPAMFDSVVSLAFVVPKDKLASAERTKALKAYMKAYIETIIFAAVNPKATALASFETNPDFLTGTTSAKVMPIAAESITAYIKTAPKTGTPESWGSYVWGTMTDEQWTATADYQIDTGTITKAVKKSDLWDGSFLKDANNFDINKVIKTAKAAPQEP